MGEMVVQKLERDRLQGPRDCGDLFEDVDAVAIFGNHALEAADLALDAA